MGKLHDACKKGNIKKIKKLIKKGYNVNKRDGCYDTPLHRIFTIDNEDLILEMLDILIENGADINKTNDYREISLHYACRMENLKIVLKLIQNGSHINKMNGDWNTPLHLAATHKNIDIIKELVKNCDCIDEQNKYGDTPLHIAAMNNNLDIVKELIKLGANTSIKNIDGLLFSDYLEYICDIEKLLEECSPLDIKEPCIKN